MEEAFTAGLKVQRRLYYKIYSMLREEGAELVGFLGSKSLEGEAREPWIRSLVVYCLSIANESMVTSQPSQMDEGKQYVDTLLELIGNKLGLTLAKMGIRVSVFSPSLPDADLRKLAVKAGLGVYGKNGLVLTENFGPRVRFGGLALSIPLDDFRERQIGELCRGCQVCISACPSGALGEKFDPLACDDYNSSLDKKKCTLCTDVCPAGK